MRISKTAIGLGLAAALASAVAFAGYKNGWEVSIDAANRDASGTLGTVRGSADALQYIGCSIAVFSSGSSSVYCYARDSAGNTASCTSSLASFITQAQNIKGDSHIYFSWDTAGACTYLYVQNNSSYAPKSP